MDEVHHRWIYKNVDSVVALTHVHKENLLQNLSLNSNKICVIPHGIDLKFFESLAQQAQPQQWRRRNGIPLHNFVVGVIGRFDPQKGQLDAIRAVEQLQNRFPNLTLVLVGKDTVSEEGTKAKCLEYVRKHKLENRVRIFDHAENIAEVYLDLNLLLVPSYKETFGLVLLEAMALGCPIAATNAGGPVEILEQGRLGFLFAPRSVQAIQDCLCEVIANPTRVMALKIYASQRIKEKYSLHAQDQGYKVLLEQLGAIQKNPDSKLRASV